MWGELGERGEVWCVMRGRVQVQQWSWRWQTHQHEPSFPKGERKGEHSCPNRSVCKVGNSTWRRAASVVSHGMVRGAGVGCAEDCMYQQS